MFRALLLPLPMPSSRVGTWSFNQSLRVPGFRITEEVPVPLSLIEPNARVLILRHEDVVFPTVSDYNIR